MFQLTDRQRSLFETAALLPEALRKACARSWAGAFREEVLPILLAHEHEFAALYDAREGRPNKSVALVVGTLLLQDMNDLTDAEAVGALDFDRRWEYAFDVEPGQAHVCVKTLHNFRVGLIEHDKSRVMFRRLTDDVIARLGIDTTTQRLDSTHILSNIARLSRLGVFCETIRIFLHALKKMEATLYETVSGGILRRHGETADYGDARKADRQRRLAVVARDTYRLVEQFKGNKVVEAMEPYGLLQRLLKERCEIVAAPESPKEGDDDQGEPPAPVALKDPKEVASNALQTPHDPDVTYSGHKGQGYEVQIAETCQDKRTPSARKNPIQIITAVNVTPSAHSDARQTLPMITALKAAGHMPETVLADTTYSSAGNAAGAARQGCNLVAPCPVKGRPDPQKQYPAPAARCPTIEAEAAEWLKQQEASPDFKKNYALRSGIEGTNSEWKRTTGAGRLRVRGGQRVELSVHFKAAALNLKRALNYWLTPLAIGEPAGVLV